MDILSLNEPPEAPVRRVSRAEAIGASMLVHALLLFLFLRGLEGLPEPIARWLRAHAARPPAPAPTAQATPMPSVSPPAPERPKPIPPIPLKFAYVKVPEDAQPKKNPNAAHLSDRDRIARQEMPTPPDAKTLTRDPHAQGDTRDRVRPDPRIAAGKEPTEAPEPKTDQLASKDIPGRGAGPEAPGDGDAEKPGEAATDQAPKEGQETPPAGTGAGQRAQATPGSAAGRRPATGAGGAAGGSAASRLPSLREQSEEKFHFDNPGWFKGGMQGTLSFDTKGFPWGDYGRKIYVIIRENWLQREPILSSDGRVPGYTCQHFVIERDGTISAVDVLKPSDHRPYTKAASDALRASSALPPLPSEFTEEREGVTGCFYYNMWPEDD